MIDLDDEGCLNLQDDSEDTATSQCQNGIDDDNDDRTDHPADPGCTSPQDHFENDNIQERQCANGLDDDDDGLIDINDPGCAETGRNGNDEASIQPACGDGLDNDNDGLIDMNDEGCPVRWDRDESDGTSECQNGIDDNQNGVTDHPADQGCTSPQDHFEDSAPSPQCGDLQDNDGDNAIDMQDRGCESFEDDSEDSDNPTATPTPIPTQEANPTTTPGTGGAEPQTPEPTATPSIVSVRQLDTNAIGGEVLLNGKGVPNVRVIVTELGELALTDQQGMFQIPAPGTEKVTFTLKVRSLKLAGGGYNIPAESGTFVSIKPREAGAYKVYDCTENNKLPELYNMGRLVTQLASAAKRDQRKLVSASKKEPSNRALRRLNFSTSVLLEINAALPDVMLTCPATQKQCSAVDLKPALRQLRASLKQLRLESLYLNRLLRSDDRRSDGKSSRRIRTIKQQVARVSTLIKKLGKTAYACK